MATKTKVPPQVITALEALYREGWRKKPPETDWATFAGEHSGAMISAVSTICAFLDIPMPARADALPVAKTIVLPTYSKRLGWTGGSHDVLFAFTDRRTGRVAVRPAAHMGGIGPEADVRVATRSEAEEWQSPLSPGWTVQS